MIRDRIVSGIQEEKLIIIGAELTLAKATDIVQTYEYSRILLKTMKGEVDGIDTSVGRGRGFNRTKCVPFSLHLKGPAFVCYLNLPYDPYHLSWTALRTKFHDKFVAINLHNASLYAETTAFNAQTLSKDTLEEFHCKLLQKWNRLHKTE